MFHGKKYNSDVSYKCKVQSFPQLVVFPPYPDSFFVKKWKKKKKEHSFLLFYILGNKNEVSIDECLLVFSVRGFYHDIILFWHVFLNYFLTEEVDFASTFLIILHFYISTFFFIWSMYVCATS